MRFLCPMNGDSGLRCLRSTSPWGLFLFFLMLAIGRATPAAAEVVFASQAGAHLDSDLMKGGGTDDTSVLQHALDRASGGHSLLLIIDGVALVSGLDVYSGTTVECTAGGGLFLKDNSARAIIRNAHRTRGNRTDEHIELRGCFLNGNRKNQPSAAIQRQDTDLSHYDESWAQRFQNVDAVIHLAGASSMMSDWQTVTRFNFDLSLNVFRAAEVYKSKRVIFASSNWVMAGYRFGDQKLTTNLAPWPINPYGCSKLFIEEAGKQFAARTGISFMALRIGYCQAEEGNVPGPHMQNGIWGQQMWLSNRDLCHGFERAVLAERVPYAVLNLMSNNPGMRWDIEETNRVIGYISRDSYAAVSTPAIEEGDRLARLEREIVDRLEQLTALW